MKWRSLINRRLGRGVIEEEDRVERELRGGVEINSMG
jgi:hypothetical protein